MKSIYVLGSINYDISLSLNIFPNEGETVKCIDSSACVGGKGFNQAFGIHRLGGEVRMCGTIGDDYYGKAVLEFIHLERFNDTYIDVQKDSITGLAIILLEGSKNRIITAGNANKMINKGRIAEFLHDAKPGDIFLTQLEIPSDAIGYALELAKEKDMITILNPSPINNAIPTLIQNCDILVLNHHEAKEIKKLLGVDDVKNFPVPNIIETLGKDGYAFIHNRERIIASAIDVKAIDTSGAGDAFIAGFVYEYAKTANIVDALKFANLVASKQITKKGTSVAMPYYDELDLN